MKLQNKKHARERLIAKRSACTVKARQQAVQAALHLLLDASFFSDSHRIACYFAQDNEFDCAPMIDAIWQRQKECYLPVISERMPNELEFARYRASDSLRLNRYQILEPDHDERISPEELDLVLLPLVGFDLEGNRLGMGGGYYDRTFAFLKRGGLEKPFLLGLGYELQKVTRVAVDAWDVSLDGVLTEKKIYRF